MCGKLFVARLLFLDRAADRIFLDDPFRLLGGVGQRFGSRRILAEVQLQLVRVFQPLAAPSIEPRQQPLHRELQFGVLL